MDLLEILNARLQSLPPGDHTPGLRAVLHHVQAALNHLARGQRTGDETAFTDTIYRTNHAFEGSLKEAYRVLAQRDPGDTSAYHIERYFQENTALRQRVLDQFTSYRTHWRNPSVHNHRLDFDEDEALLAIVSVSAFAIVLLGQIAEWIAFQNARALTRPEVVAPDQTQSLAEAVARLMQSYHMTQAGQLALQQQARESELVAAIAGYLSAALPHLQYEVGMRLQRDPRLKPDLRLSMADQRVLVEVKRVEPSSAAVAAAVHQAGRYLDASGIEDGIVYLRPRTSTAIMRREDHSSPTGGGRIIVLQPEREPLDHRQ